MSRGPSGCARSPVAASTRRPGRAGAPSRRRDDAGGPDGPTPHGCARPSSAAPSRSGSHPGGRLDGGCAVAGREHLRDEQAGARPDGPQPGDLGADRRRRSRRRARADAAGAPGRGAGWPRSRAGTSCSHRGRRTRVARPAADSARARRRRPRRCRISCSRRDASRPSCAGTPRATGAGEGLFLVRRCCAG